MQKAIEGQLTLLKCVADETRFKILLMLKDGDRCVCDIVKELKAEQSLISHHLQSLRRCGLVTSVREGKKIRYKLADPRIAELLAKIDEVSGELSKCTVA
jgi:ArsR family transcriptional regulator